MKTFVLQPSSTWRKLGFSLFSDSLSYREVLELNSKWNVMELPPVGAVLFKPLSTLPSAGITQSQPLVPRGRSEQDSEFYPFSSREEYEEALSLYPPPSLRDIDRINGWSTGSPEITG